MKLSEKIILKICNIINESKIAGYYKTNHKNKNTSPFKLVFFCGKNGINYLNASLVSVQKKWDSIPELMIVTDGTPADLIRQKLIDWPREVEIIVWTEAYDYYKNQNNDALAEYGKKELWGKKFISILYCASKYPCLYSDTDILWFSTPKLSLPDTSPILKMTVDIEYCYSDIMLKELDINLRSTHPALNAGLIYAHGNFTSFPKWADMCQYLATKPDDRTEQTGFAILNSFFNPSNYFTLNEVLIKIDDEFSLKNTSSSYKNILARHYVNVKFTTFWRDFVYMMIRK